MSWKETLAAVAPTIATALGGPLAGMAVKIATDKLGIEPEALEAAVTSGRPEVFYNLKAAESSFLLEMEKLGIERDRLVIDDRKDARGLAKLNMWPQIILSAIYTAGYFGLIFGLLSGELSMPVGDAGHLMAGLIGVLTAMQIKIGDFWFGSSHGSKLKSK